MYASLFNKQALKPRYKYPKIIVNQQKKITKTPTRLNVRFFNEEEIKFLPKELYLQILANNIKEHTSQALEFKCVYLNLYFKFDVKTLLWKIYEENKIQISWGEYANKCVKSKHFCNPFQNINLNSLFHENNFMILQNKYPIDKFAQLLFIYNINYVSSFNSIKTNISINNTTQDFLHLNTNFIYNRDLWDKNCNFLDENLVKICKKINNFDLKLNELKLFSLSYDFKNKNILLTYEKFMQIFSIQDYFLDLLNLISAFSKFDNIFQYQPQGYIFWRYAFAIHTIKYLIENYSHRQSIIDKLRIFFKFNEEFNNLFQEHIEKLLQRNNKEYYILCVQFLFDYVTKYFAKSKFEEILYIIYKQSFFHHSTFSLLEINFNYEVDESDCKTNPIYKSLYELYSRNNSIDLFFNQTIPPNYSDNYNERFVNSVSIANLLLSKNYEKLSRFLNTLHNFFNLNENNNSLNVNFLLIFDNIDISNICSYYNILLSIYNNIGSIRKFFFDFILNILNLSHDINKSKWLYILMLLNPLSKDEQRICANILQNNKIFNKEELEFSKSNLHIILKDNVEITDSFIIDLSDGSPSEIEYYIID